MDIGKGAGSCWAPILTLVGTSRGQGIVRVVTSVGTTIGQGIITELLLLRHFSEVLIFWKIFKVIKAQILTF